MSKTLLSRNRPSIVHLATKEETRAERISRGFTVALFIMLLLTLLLALLMGTNVYRSLTDARNSATTLRMESSLLVNSIRMNDEAGAVSEGEGPEGRALVLAEMSEGSVYEMRFYLYEGQLLQEYAQSDTPYTPGRASVITDTETFDFSYEGNLLTIRTDSGSTTVALRSAEGGA